MFSCLKDIFVLLEQLQTSNISGERSWWNLSQNKNGKRIKMFTELTKMKSNFTFVWFHIDRYIYDAIPEKREIQTLQIYLEKNRTARNVITAKSSDDIKMAERNLVPPNMQLVLSRLVTSEELDHMKPAHAMAKHSILFWTFNPSTFRDLLRRARLRASKIGTRIGCMFWTL